MSEDFKNVDKTEEENKIKYIYIKTKKGNEGEK